MFRGEGGGGCCVNRSSGRLRDFLANKQRNKETNKQTERGQGEDEDENEG